MKEAEDHSRPGLIQPANHDSPEQKQRWGEILALRENWIQTGVRDVPRVNQLTQDIRKDWQENRRIDTGRQDMEDALVRAQARIAELEKGTMTMTMEQMPPVKWLNAKWRVPKDFDGLVILSNGGKIGTGTIEVDCTGQVHVEVRGHTIALERETWWTIINTPGMKYCDPMEASITLDEATQEAIDALDPDEREA